MIEDCTHVIKILQAIVAEFAVSLVEHFSDLGDSVYLIAIKTNSYKTHVGARRFPVGAGASVARVWHCPP